MFICESGDRQFSEYFDDNCSRLNFVRHVFLILIMALLAMFGQIFLVPLIAGLKSFLDEYYWLAIIGATIFIGCCMILSCSNVARSEFPWNLILFIVLIESLTLIKMVSAAIQSPNVILLSIACLTVVLFLLLILAMTVPVDFSKRTVVFLVLFLIVFTFAIAQVVSIYTLNLPIMDFVYAMIAVTIFSLIMLLSLQRIFDGGLFELCPDDYIFGAILMLAHAMIFFMCCLKLIGFNANEC